MSSPFTPQEERTINNHIPHVLSNARLFLNTYKIDVPDSEKQLRFLITLIDQMESDLQEVKTLIENKLE